MKATTALAETTAHEVGIGVQAARGGIGVAPDALLRFAARLLWKLYKATENDVIIDRRVLFCNVRIRVRDLRPVLVMWLGEPPVDLGGDPSHFDPNIV
jgi:hypothetical protein